MIDPQLAGDEPAAASERNLRQFAALWILLFGGLAARSWFGGAPTVRAVMLLAAALAVGIPGLLRPALIRPLFEGAIALTRPIGAVVWYLLLALVVLRPVHAVRRDLQDDWTRRAGSPPSTESNELLAGQAPRS